MMFTQWSCSNTSKRVTSKDGDFQINWIRLFPLSTNWIVFRCIVVWLPIRFEECYDDMYTTMLTCIAYWKSTAVTVLEPIYQPFIIPIPPFPLDKRILYGRVTGVEDYMQSLWMPVKVGQSQMWWPFYIALNTDGQKTVTLRILFTTDIKCHRITLMKFRVYTNWIGTVICLSSNE